MLLYNEKQKIIQNIKRKIQNNPTAVKVLHKRGLEVEDLHIFDMRNDGRCINAGNSDLAVYYYSPDVIEMTFDLRDL